MTTSRLSTLLAATLMAGGLIMGTPAYATPLVPFTVTDTLEFIVGSETSAGGTFANVTPTELEWRDGATPTSFLRIISPPTSTPVVILSDTGGWVNIAQLQHENNVIPGGLFSFNIDVFDSLTIPGVTFTATGTNTLATILNISFLETANVLPVTSCPAPNPLGTSCDDRFTVMDLDDVLGSFMFTALGEDWTITFRILAEEDAGTFFDPANNTIYTAEAETSNLFIQAQINQIPEPGSLALLGIGLVGLPLFARRAKKADTKKA